jgi:hypothetical protein
MKAGASGSVFLATWETVIRRTAVQSQPGKIVHETLISEIPNTKK